MSKPKFDPSKPYDIVGKPKFNPNEKYEEVVDQEFTPTESFGKSAVQSITGGFGDEIGGAVQGAMDKVSGMFGGDSVSQVNKKLADQGFTGMGATDSGEMYTEARDENRIDLARAKAENTDSFMAGGLVGDVALGAMPGMGAMKGAGALANIGKSAAIGGLQGLGNAKELDGQGLSDAAMGAGIAGGVSGIGHGLASYIKNINAGKIGSKASELAEIRSAQAQGLERGTRNKLNGDDILREARVRAVGRQGLDDKIVTTFANTKKMVGRNEALKADLMDTRKFAYDFIDDNNASTFNPFDTADGLGKDLGKFNWASDLNAPQLNQLEKSIQAVSSRGGKPITMAEAQELVQELGKAAKFDSNKSAPANDMAKDVYKYVREKMNESAEGASELLGTPGLKDTIQAANSKYSVAKDAGSLLKNKLARESNKKFNLTDIIALSGSNPFIYFPKKVYEEYGDRVMAQGMDKIGDYLTKNPDAFGKFSKVLQDASSRGSQAVAATHFLLQQQDPEYVELLKQMQGEEK